MALNCVIIDDDPLSTTLIEKYCSKMPELLVRSVYHDPVVATEELREGTADLIFLDVKMPGMTGFGVLDNLDYQPMVIMTTGDEDSAFKAYEYQAIDFLKKPVRFERFLQSVEKALAWHEQSTSRPLASVFIRYEGKLISIPFEQIDYVQAVGDYIKVFTLEKTFLVQITLKSFEEKLPESLFVRVHRSFLVNISKVQQVSSQKLVIQQREIPISRSQKQEVYGKLNIS